MTAERKEILAYAQHYIDQNKKANWAYLTNDAAAYTGYKAEATNALRKLQVAGNFKTTDIAAAFIRAEQQAGNIK